LIFWFVQIWLKELSCVYYIRMGIQQYTDIINKREAEFVATLSYIDFFKYFPRDVKDLDEQGSCFKVVPNREYFKLVQNYIKTMIKSNFEMKVYYNTSDKNPNGRVYSKSPISLQRIHSPLRAFLTKGLYHDYDMKNAHPTILCAMCEDAGLSNVYQKNYIQNRAKVLKDNNTDKKTILIKLNTDDARANSSWNKDLKELLSEWKIAKRYFHKINESKYTKTNDKNPISSITNKMMCEKENEILHRALPHDTVCIVPMFDGFLCSKQLDITELPNDTCDWDEKPIETNVEVPSDFTFVPEAEVVNENTYEDMKVEFEKKHAKIIEISAFVLIGDVGDVILKSEAQLTISYRHLHYMKWVDKENGGYYQKQSFITEWLNDPDMKTYDRMDVFPNAEKCPPNVFNTWTPFAAETWTAHETIHEEAVDDFINHCKVLSGNNLEVCNLVFIPFLAHMIQYPDMKSFVINLISGQGAGKGTLLDIISAIIGLPKVLETQKPLRDIFGDHNAQMTSKYLVILDEVKKSDMNEVQGQYKGLVTTGNININPKGKDIFTIKSYHRFLSTSNDADSMPTKTGDRRNIIIRSSDELIGKKEYFTKMHGYINDPRAIWSIFMFLKNLPDVPQVFDVANLPHTDYQNTLQEASRDYIDLWLESLTVLNPELDIKKMTSSEVFQSWSDWVIDNNIECKTTKPQLEKNISLKQYIEISSERTKTCRLKVFDLVQLRKRFNTCLM